MGMIYEDMYIKSIISHLEQLEIDDNLHVSVDNCGYLIVEKTRTPIFITSLCPVSINRGTKHKIIIRQQGCEIEINPHGQITMWLRVKDNLYKLYGLRKIHKTLDILGPEFFLSFRVNALFPRDDDSKDHRPIFDIHLKEQYLFLQEHLARRALLVLVGKMTAAELLFWTHRIRTLCFFFKRSFTAVEAIIASLEQFLLKNYY